MNFLKIGVPHIQMFRKYAPSPALHIILKFLVLHGYTKDCKLLADNGFLIP